MSNTVLECRRGVAFERGVAESASAAVGPQSYGVCLAPTGVAHGAGWREHMMPLLYGEHGQVH